MKVQERLNGDLVMPISLCIVYAMVQMITTFGIHHNIALLSKFEMKLVFDDLVRCPNSHGCVGKLR